MFVEGFHKCEACIFSVANNYTLVCLHIEFFLRDETDWEYFFQISVYCCCSTDIVVEGRDTPISTLLFSTIDFKPMYQSRDYSHVITVIYLIQYEDVPQHNMNSFVPNLCGLS